MRQLYEQIGGQQEVRHTLIEIKAVLKDEEKKKQLQQLFDVQPRVLADCLKHEDPKVRKNAALILGELQGQEIPKWLWTAYEQEEQLLVRGDYLKALAAFDCSPYLEALKGRQKELEEAQADKHLRQELMELRKLLFRQETQKGHAFTGYEEPVDVLLMTNKGHERLLASQVKEVLGEEVNLRLIKGGVQAVQVQIEKLLPLRTYRELLFCLKGSKRMPAEDAAELLMQTDLPELLGRLHEGEGPYYFRIDCKSSMDLGQRSAFCKRLAAQLEERSGGALRNAPSAYEIEIRFVENKEGSFYPLLKLHTLPDKRFAYRKYTVAASMAPVQAALCMELAAPYLKEQAQVLDPFCGAGTMLLERNYKLHANTLYGIDLYAPAIEGARANAEIAGVPAHFINRDSLSFTHGYLFDEIVTNFPTKGKSLDAHGLDCLYGQFLDKAERLLKPEGMILLYAHDRGYVKKHLRMRPQWKLTEEWCISEKEGTWLFCIQGMKR